MTRSEAIKALTQKTNPMMQYEALDMAIKALEEPERKKGKWRVYGSEMTCSYCETTFYTNMCEYIDGNVPRFCPWCGADMREEKTDDPR